MKIFVTKQHIKLGVPRCFKKCPVALALDSVLNKGKKNKRKSYVFSSKIYLSGKECNSINVPKRVLDFIKKFDADKEVKPFSFTLKPRYDKQKIKKK